MVFNEFFVISNKISQSLHFWLWKLSCKTSVFRAPFESLKSVEFPMHTVVRNSNSRHFHSNAPSFRIILYCEIASLKRKRLLPSEKYKAITKVKSGKKPLKVAKKYGIPRNTIWTWLLPGKKEILKVFLICSLFEEEQVAFSPAKSSSQRELYNPRTNRQR